MTSRAETTEPYKKAAKYFLSHCVLLIRLCSISGNQKYFINLIFNLHDLAPERPKSTLEKTQSRVFRGVATLKYTWQWYHTEALNRSLEQETEPYQQEENPHPHPQRSLTSMPVIKTQRWPARKISDGAVTYHWVSCRVSHKNTQNCNNNINTSSITSSPPSAKASTTHCFKKITSFTQRLKFQSVYTFF